LVSFHDIVVKVRRSCAFRVVQEGVRRGFRRLLRFVSAAARRAELGG
jgi:hypothetical protein